MYLCLPLYSSYAQQQNLQNVCIENNFSYCFMSILHLYLLQVLYPKSYFNFVRINRTQINERMNEWAKTWIWHIDNVTQECCLFNQTIFVLGSTEWVGSH
jgi:hypothetical protein